MKYRATQCEASNDTSNIRHRKGKLANHQHRHADRPENVSFPTSVEYLTILSLLIS